MSHHKINSKQTKEDVFSTTSSKPGFAGWLEAFFRKNRTLAQILVMSPLALCYVLVFGLSLLPTYLLLRWNITSNALSGAFDFIVLIFSLGACLISFVFTMIIIVPILNIPVKPFVRPNRGSQYSLESIAWMYHNALAYMVRYTVLEFITPTPFAQWYFKRMGMKIGKGVLINTSHISDLCMITLEDNVTIGGSATLLAHYGMKGYLIIEPVIIKKGATVGLKASIMGDVIVGEGAMIKPHQVLLPKTRVGDGEVI